MWGEDQRIPLNECKEMKMAEEWRRIVAMSWDLDWLYSWPAFKESLFKGEKMVAVVPVELPKISFLQERPLTAAVIHCSALQGLC